MRLVYQYLICFLLAGLLGTCLTLGSLPQEQWYVYVYGTFISIVMALFGIVLIHGFNNYERGFDY